MREAAFVKQNKDKWLKFENVISNKNQIHPDELSNLYIEVTDHLSYAQTFYPGSKTLEYLNYIASQSHQIIYKSKKESSKRFITFFTREFPLLMYQYQKQLLIAFLTFMLFAIIGAYSAANDGAFVRTILGDNYVNMTLENIEKGDPMGVYFSIGSLMIIMRNAIMVGSFQYFFFEQGVGWESVRTIWIHGTIEISVIIIAGCAGMVVGNSMMFPKTYTRLDSFVKGVKNSLKIILSTIPFFIVAGFLEGFVTRHTEMPDWLAIAIIGVSLSLIVFYYVIYPRQLYKKQQNTHIHTPKIPILTE